MDRGAWKATAHGVAKSWIQLSNFTLNRSQAPVFIAALFTYGYMYD